MTTTVFFMRWRHLLGAVLTAAAVVVPPKAHAVEIAVEPWELATPAAGVAVASWLSSPDETYWKSPSVWSLPDRDGGSWASAHCAIDADHLYIRVEVRDAVHVKAAASDVSTPNADGLRVTVDARGDGVGKLAAWTPLRGPGDLVLSISDAGDGNSLIWRWAPDEPHSWAGAPSAWGQVKRDASAQTTVYSLALPWSALPTQAAVAPTIGLGIEPCDVNAAGAVRCSLWGGKDGLHARPRGLTAVALAPPPEAHVAISPVRRAALSADQPAVVGLVLGRAVAGTLEVSVGRAKKSLRLSRGSSQDGARRFAVKLWFTPSEADLTRATAVVELRPETANVRAMRWKGEIVQAAAVHASLASRWEGLARRSRGLLGGLLQEHMHAAAALFEAAWLEGSARWYQSTDRADALVAEAIAATDAAEKRGASWDTLQQAGGPLLLTMDDRYIGPRRFYSVVLPKDWDGTRSYPLVVNLPDAPARGRLGFLSDVLQGRHGLLSTVQGEAQPFVLVPWCAGRCGESPGWEQDVLDAVEEVKRRFSIDDDRVSLVGFGRAAPVVWSLALHNPAPWAAVALAASARPYRGTVGQGVGRNLKGVPVWLWHGARDRVVPLAEVQALRNELGSHGVDLTLVVDAEAGHWPGDKVLAEAMGWLMERTRGPLRDFAYTSFDDEHRGRNGVWLRRVPDLSIRPSFSAELRGRLVRITSQGTTGLTVELGSEGLGLTEEVELLWNGVPVYQGPPRTIELGSGGGP